MSRQVQPYQILFPLGIVYAVWGALMWGLFAVGLLEYPGALHADVMVAGFLFSFASGFLLTAVPRFTGAPRARWFELGLASALALTPLFAADAKLAVLRLSFALALLLFLAAFFVSRFSRRAYAPPEHFIFIPMGLLCGILGATLLITIQTGGVDGRWTLPARTLFYQGTMLCFVLGVGGKLVTALLGWAAPPLVEISNLSNSKRNTCFPLRTTVVIQAMILFTGFAVEFTSARAIGPVLRALVGVWVAFGTWKLHRRSRTPGRLANWLWISAWGIVVGLVASAVYPSAGIHALHLMFICGFGLMTLMIASRVTLAHGGYGLDLELKSSSIRWAGALIVFAALTRAFAPWTPSYTQHLGYAALLWIFAVIIWMVAFAKKIIVPAPGEKTTHSNEQRC